MHKKIIIIGSGILGASTAYYLAIQGTEVVIIDRMQEGQATDAAAGIVCPWISQRRNKAWYHLAKNGASLYPTLIDQLAKDGEIDTGYSRVGAISLHTDEKKLTAMRDRALKRREDAPEIGDVTMLDIEQTRSLFPILSDAYHSVHISGAARVDGRKLRDSLLRAASKHGATTITGDASLVKDGAKIIGVSVNDSIIEADTVIAATGAWMNELFEPLDITFDVIPQKAQIMHVKLPNTDTSKWPVVMPPSSQYMLAFNDRIVIGTTHENDTGFDHRVTVGGTHEIVSHAMEIAPGLSDAAILETRVGFRPFTPGFLPVIGALPNYDGLYLANGLGSSGLTMGPFIGKQLANLALGNELEIDLSDYDVAGAIK
ncbi:NAD(P)/FAD-dependent oxidoreductase [Oceanobacillus chungangensis]|uniref:FAD-dependent oxidoreductase n=1 Tax=Oceanobacillus chungangensis TaxID=1229152 RepID=A0A3D8PVG6_9BACI|nr:FAD-binding oxidoreductase [Oceanobacillus chungangensis]RDW19722.1 FAD-dependent oxidoreductase [Oceanobacillus chungangensis]